MLWTKKLINLAMVFSGIGLCLYDAVSGSGLMITFVILLFLIFHSAFTNGHLMEISIIIIAGVIGAIAESINVGLGFYQYVNVEDQLKFLPTWVVLIWFLAGATARTAFAGTSNKIHFTVAAGILFGVSMYSASVQSGAIHYLTDGMLPMAATILSWTIAFTAIITFSNKFFEVSVD